MHEMMEKIIESGIGKFLGWQSTQIGIITAMG